MMKACTRNKKNKDQEVLSEYSFSSEEKLRFYNTESEAYKENKEPKPLE